MTQLVDLRIPTYLTVEAKMRELSAQGIGVYVLNKGERMGGMILQKILNPQARECKLLTQQRDLDGVLGWESVFSDEIIEENRADEYIARAIDRDPDIWVIEIENASMENVFDNA